MIVVPSVLKSYNTNKEKLYNVMVENICRSSNLFFEEYQAGLVKNQDDLCTIEENTEYCDITIQKLMDEKYLDKDLENPKTERPITLSRTSIVARYNTSSGLLDSNGNPIYTFIVTIDDEEHVCNQ